MKILDETVSPMHLWTMILLAAVAGVSSYVYGAFPYALAVAVIVAMATEFVVKAGLRHRQRLPLSAIITGIIIGSIAPQNAPFALVLVACIIAVLSKHFLKARHNPIFNPASLGLVVALAVFRLGDVWWGSGSYSMAGMTISLAPVLIFVAYLSKRLHASLAFVVTVMAISAAMAGFASVSSLGGLDALVFGVNYYFAFVMLAEPKTSPGKAYQQAAYGFLVALLYFVLALRHEPYAFLLALLVGNATYALYRSRK